MIVSLRALPLPLMRTFAFGTSVVSLELVVTVTPDVPDSTSSTTKSAVTAKSSFTVPVTSPLPFITSVVGLILLRLNIGASFTEANVTLNVVEAVLPSESLTVRVMLAVPNWLATGVIVTSGLLALFGEDLLNVMFPAGTKPGFEDVPDNPA